MKTSSKYLNVLLKSVTNFNNLRIAKPNITIGLSGANLEFANLSEAMLHRTNLSYANLSRAKLIGVNLRSSNLTGTYLKLADLTNADMTNADLTWANLTGVNLTGANLTGVNLTGANLAYSIMNEVIGIESIIAKTRILPDGDIIGWKKCMDGVIVKLLIPSTSRRSSAFGRKCRAEFAYVLKIFGASEGVSEFDNNVIYRIGERIVADRWDDDFRNECSNGIHFFITRKEAEIYQ